MIARPNTGFTLVEMIMVISLLAIISVGAITFTGNFMEDARFEQTLQNMTLIRKGLVGDPDRKIGSIRSDFGFFGDCGTLPTAGEGLQALLTKPAGRPVFTVDATVRFGLGWNGPYLRADGTEGPAAVALKDAWGRAYVYIPAASPPTITSLGRDGLAGGTGVDQDIVMTIPAALQSGELYGYVTSGGATYSGAAEIQLKYVDSSTAIATQTVAIVPADNGAFKFNTVPLGKRSLMIYVPNSLTPTTTRGPYLITVSSNHELVPFGTIDLTL